MGQGITTVLAQIAAERLGVGMQDVHVVRADTVVFTRAAVEGLAGGDQGGEEQ